MTRPGTKILGESAGIEHRTTALEADALTFSQRHTSGLVLCFPSVANAALAS